MNEKEVKTTVDGEIDISQKEYPGPMETGKFIKQLRKSHGMTQENIAEKVFVTRKAVSKWENGECYPQIDVVMRLSDIFGISTDEILYGEFKKEEHVLEEDQMKMNFTVRMIKNRYVKRFVISSFLVLFTCLVIFFIDNYNATKIYNVYYEDDYVYIKNAVIVTTKSKEYFNFGYILTDFADIDKNTRINYTLFTYDNAGDVIELISFASNKLSEYQGSGYKELSIVNIRDKLNKLYLKVDYINTKGEEICFDIHLKVKLTYQSNDLFDFKVGKDTEVFEDETVPGLPYKEEKTDVDYIDEEYSIDLSFLFEMSESELKKKYNNKSIVVDNKKIYITIDGDKIKIDYPKYRIIISAVQKSVSFEYIRNQQYYTFPLLDNYIVNFSSERRQEYKIITQYISYLEAM